VQQRLFKGMNARAANARTFRYGKRESFRPLRECSRARVLCAASRRNGAVAALFVYCPSRQIGLQTLFKNERV